MNRNGSAGRIDRITRRVDVVRSAVEQLENRLLLSTYLINLNTVSVNGGAATAVNANSTITGTSGADTFIVENTSVNFTIDGAGGADSITDYTGLGSQLTVTDSGGSGEDTIIVRAPSATQADMDLNIATKTITNGTDEVFYSTDAPTAVSLIGQLFSAGDNLTVDANSGADVINLASTTITFGSPAVKPTISYSTFNSLTINGNGGADTFNVNSDSISTTLYDGNSTTRGSGSPVNFNINSNTVTLAINGGSVSDIYTVASNSGPITINSGTALNDFNPPRQTALTSPSPAPALPRTIPTTSSPTAARSPSPTRGR